MPPDEPVFEIVDDDFVPRKQSRRDARVRRLRALAWMLDAAFSIGGWRRFGFESLIDLIPGVGDWIGGTLSLYILYEAARLGLPWRVIARMGVNVGVEMLVGSVPVAGPVFDFLWQANLRNLRLVEQHDSPHLRERPIGRIALFLVFCAIALLAAVSLLSAFIAIGLWKLFTRS